MHEWDNGAPEGRAPRSTHRNAAINTIGTLLHLPMGVGSRYLWTLPMFHANGWTGHLDGDGGRGHRYLLPQGRPGDHLRADQGRAGELAGAPLMVPSRWPTRPPPCAGRCACRGERGDGAGHRRRPPPSSGWKGSSAGGYAGLRADRTSAPFITVCAPLPEHVDMPPADRARSRRGRGSSCSPGVSCAWWTPRGGARGRADCGQDRRPRQRRHGRGTTTTPRRPRTGHG